MSATRKPTPYRKFPAEQGCLRIPSHSMRRDIGYWKMMINTASWWSSKSRIVNRENSDSSPLVKTESVLPICAIHREKSRLQTQENNQRRNSDINDLICCLNEKTFRDSFYGIVRQERNTAQRIEDVDLSHHAAKIQAYEADGFEENRPNNGPSPIPDCCRSPAARRIRSSGFRRNIGDIAETVGEDMPPTAVHQYRNDDYRPDCGIDTD